MEPPIYGNRRDEHRKRGFGQDTLESFSIKTAATVAVERPAGGFEGFEGKQTAGLNALKNRWLGRVAARVALERPAEGFEALACESCLGKACGKVWSWELPRSVWAL